MRPPFARKKEIIRELPGPEIKLSGHFDLVAVKPDGTERPLASFTNMITDAGLDFFCSNTAATPLHDNGSASIVGAFTVGASGEPENPSHTSLIAPIATVYGVNNFSDHQFAVTALPGDPYVWRCVKTRRFGAGAAAGNIAEVGVGWYLPNRSGFTLFSRALVKDDLGEPTTVQVGSDEYLDVTYTLFIQFDISDKPFTLNLSSGSHNGVLRPGEVSAAASRYVSMGLLLTGNYSLSAGNPWYVSRGGLGDITGRITGSLTQTSRQTGLVPYIPGSFFRDVDFILGLSTGNITGGFTALHVGLASWVGYQFSFDPAIPKTGDHIFSIRVRISIGRG